VAQRVAPKAPDEPYTVQRMSAGARAMGVVVHLRHIRQCDTLAPIYG